MSTDGKTILVVLASYAVLGSLRFIIDVIERLMVPRQPRWKTKHELKKERWRLKTEKYNDTAMDKMLDDVTWEE